MNLNSQEIEMIAQCVSREISACRTIITVIKDDMTNNRQVLENALRVQELRLADLEKLSKKFYTDLFHNQSLTMYFPKRKKR